MNVGTFLRSGGCDPVLCKCMLELQLELQWGELVGFQGGAKAKEGIMRSSERVRGFRSNMKRSKKQDVIDREQRDCCRLIVSRWFCA